MGSNPFSRKLNWTTTTFGEVASYHELEFLVPWQTTKSGMYELKVKLDRSELDTVLFESAAAARKWAQGFFDGYRTADMTTEAAVDKAIEVEFGDGEPI